MHGDKIVNLSHCESTTVYFQISLVERVIYFNMEKISGASRSALIPIPNEPNQLTVRGIPGLLYIKDFISLEEEEALVCRSDLFCFTQV